MKAAAAALEKCHMAGHTIIETYHMCALKNWPTIVRLASESTVVFGLIDVGDYFDVAVQSLAIINHIPYVLGGTFCHQYSVDFIKPDPKTGCACCAFGNMNPEVVKLLVPSKIAQITDLSFIPRNSNPIGQSNVYLAAMCAQLMVARFCTYLLHDPEIEALSFERLLCYVNTGESIKLDNPKNPTCLICNHP